MMTANASLNAFDDEICSVCKWECLNITYPTDGFAHRVALVSMLKDALDASSFRG